MARLRIAFGVLTLTVVAVVVALLISATTQAATVPRTAPGWYGYHGGGTHRGASSSMPDAGAPPPLQHPPMGCVFHPRCPLAEAACVRSVPHLRRVGPEHYAACHFVGESD